LTILKRFLNDDKDEALYLLASTLAEQAADARAGASRAGKDELVAYYLTGRAKTLENALGFIQQQHPNLVLI
jgi:hypothetical protein